LTLRSIMFSFVSKERELLIEAKVQKEAMERKREAELELAMLERNSLQARVEDEKKKKARYKSVEK
jgi:hypothetical protein